MQQKLVRSFQYLNRSSLSLTTNREFKTFVKHLFRDGLLYKKVQDLPQKEYGFLTPTWTNQKEPKPGINSGFAQENSQRDGRKILQWIYMLQMLNVNIPHIYLYYVYVSHLLFSTTIGQITVLIADATLNNYMDRLSMLWLCVIIRFISCKGKICKQFTVYHSPKEILFAYVLAALLKCSFSCL